MTLEEKMRHQKRAFSSGKAFNLGLSRIGKIVFYCVNHHTIELKHVKQVKGGTACAVLAKKLAAEKYQGTGETPDKLTVAQMKIILGTLKCDGDRAIPTNKGLLIWLEKWEVRGTLSVEEKVIITMDASWMELKRDEYKPKLEDDEEEEEVCFEQV